MVITNAILSGVISPQYNQVADRLRRAILNGDYASGTRLPPERALCTQYYVSRITVRGALGVLEEEQLIIRRQGSGTYVRQNPTRRIPLLIDYTGSVRQHAPNLMREVLTSRVCTAPEWVADELQLSPSTTILYAERLDQADGIAVAWDEVYIPRNFARDLGLDQLKRIDFIESWREWQGVNPAACRQRVEAVTATGKDGDRLDLTDGAPLLKTIELYETGSNRPIGLFVSHYHPKYITVTARHIFAG